MTAENPWVTAHIGAEMSVLTDSELRFLSSDHRSMRRIRLMAMVQENWPYNNPLTILLVTQPLRRILSELRASD